MKKSLYFLYKYILKKIDLKLVYSIPLITAVILFFTAIVNVVSFQIFSEQAFEVYVTEIPLSVNSPDPEKLQAFLKLGSLDTKTRDEYLSTIAELSNLSNAIENISKNPELYMWTGPSGSWSEWQILLPTATKVNQSLFPLLNIREFWKDTAEWRFVTNTFKWLIWVNIVWILLILCVYFAWIRSIFRPIQIVTENIKNIIDRKKYATIRYPGKNEFSPLISTINNLQKTLSIQEKIRSDFLSDISHEIRTPITAVQCYLEAIEDGMMQLDETTLPMLQAELKRLTDITSGIMNYERLTSDIFEDIKVETFFLFETTQPIIESYRPQLEKSKQSILVDFLPEEKINMDKNMYIQILHNIFSNFLKYAWEKTTLQISINKTKKEFILIFSDNGIGIPDKEIAYVKEKFYKVNKARTGDRYGSMGIGLSIIERIARLHRGTLTLEKHNTKWLNIIIRIKR